MLKSIPTNVITGFLGVGKSSAILHLLDSKPKHERWAVLVNEFGEVGVDGELFAGQHGEDAGVFIAEVPGGCMCCAAGVPMQIALGQLLRRAKPDRLLIEPSGLGHPKEVLQVLSSEHYQSVISLGPTLTLVDARSLSDPRYTSNSTYQQQIAIADVIVGSKCDLYQEGDKQRLREYAVQWGQVDVKVTEVSQGRVLLDWLKGETRYQVEPIAHLHTEQTSTPVAEQPIPECGYIEAVNSGSGFQSIGWRFSPVKTFSRSALIGLLKRIDVERLKAVVITDDGVFAYNRTRDSLTEQMLDDCLETRIEVISDQLDRAVLKQSLFNCLV